MTVEGMIRQLQNLIEHGLKPTAVIKAWDGDSGEWQPVTGFLYDADSVELQTDSDDEEPISAGLEGRGGELDALRNKLFESDAFRGELRRELDIATARAAQLEAALRAIKIALKEPAGGEYWTAREFLDKLGIFHDDLNDLRVLHKVAEAALGPVAQESTE